MSTEPVAARTAGEVKFSQAISCSVRLLAVELLGDEAATSGSADSAASQRGHVIR